jgi:hypothetical protein
MRGRLLRARRTARPANNSLERTRLACGDLERVLPAKVRENESAVARAAGRLSSKPLDAAKEGAMEYEELKSELQAIVALCETIPEAYRLKSFEILLAARIAPQRPAARAPAEAREQGAVTPPAEEEKVPTPAQVRVFMQRNSISEQLLPAVFLFAGGDLHFIKEPAPPSVAEGQIQWALLLALKSGILNNNIAVDPEDVRSICQEKGFYDGPNFAAIFKRPSNAKLFKGLLEPQGEARSLSPEGEAELAKLLRALAGA